MCIDEIFCERVIEDLTIMSKIFYYANSESSALRLRKNSLKCLTNIIKITLDGDS